MDEVLIVGGGPTGFAIALGLAQAGVRVRLIEALDDIVRAPRAAVHHSAVLDGFARLGVLDECIAEGLVKQDYCWLVKNTGERIEFDLSVLEGHAEHPFNLHLGQDRLAAAMRRRFEGTGNGTVEFRVRFTGLAQDAGGVTVHAEGPDGPREYRARWVVGADGAGSAVRKAIGVNFPGMTWPDRFIATNIRGDLAANGYARTTMVIDGTYGAVIVQISQDGLWRYTYKEAAGLPEETYPERMPRFFAEMLSGIDVELVDSAPYRMHQRCAERMRLGRVLLAGDAAHATNPTGALGLTSGFFDAFALYPVLAAVVLEGADDAVLDRWEQSRREIFLGHASPRAVANKQLVFHAEGLEAGVAGLRLMRDGPDVRRERMLFVHRLASPPLLDAVRA